MGPEEGLESRLRSLLGLNSYEARAYLAILSSGRPLKPREVAREAGIPYQRVYDTLEKLEQKGLVYRLEDGSYDAEDPERALGLLAERYIAEAVERARKVKDLAGDLASRYTARSRGGQLRVVYGLDRILLEAAETLRGCRGPAYFTTYKVAEEAERLRDQLTWFAGRLAGVEGPIRILVYEDYDPPEWVFSILPESNSEIRKTRLVFMDLMVACSTTIIGLPGLRDVVAVIVDHQDFSEAVRRRIEYVWRNLSKPLKAPGASED